MILALFVLFLLPFDRRIIERYLMPLGAEHGRSTSVTSRTRSGKPEMDDGSTVMAMPGGPYTRQVCNLLALEVVVLRDLSSSPTGSCSVELAIGRWNEEAWEFEVVTGWCQTWEDLEDEARQAMKSFQGIASPNYRGASQP